jgi:hypothetical protein
VELPSKKITATIIVVALAVGVAVVVANLETGSASNAKLNNAGYLGESKLFLISATSTYGIHNGQTCFIINATIRNDYTAEQPPPMDNWMGNSTGDAYFGLTASLYHGNEQVSASDVTAPVIPALGFHQIGLGGGQTAAFEIDMATTRRNIDSYSINLQIIAGYPIP